MTRTRASRRPDRGRCRPSVESLEIRNLLSAAPDALDSLIGASLTRSEYGVDGHGHSVAVIDTGVNYQNPALGGRIGSGAKVVGGYDFAQNDADPMATWQHGTAVAGIVASGDADHPGVAP